MGFGAVYFRIDFEIIFDAFWNGSDGSQGGEWGPERCIFVSILSLRLGCPSSGSLSNGRAGVV